MLIESQINQIINKSREPRMKRLGVPPEKVETSNNQIEENKLVIH
jgi:hypothetical protein